MKYNIAILLLLAFSFQNCNQTSHHNPEKIIAPSVVENDSDTSHSDDWIRKAVQKRIKDIYPSVTTEIEKTVKLNDSVFFVLYTINDLVSHSTYIMTFKNNKPLEELMISNEVDADFSIPHYEYTEYKEKGKDDFLISGFEQNVKFPDKVLTKEGRFKEGFNFENVDIITDTIVTRVNIQPGGIILKDTLKNNQ